MSFLNKRKSGSRSSLSTAITMLRDSPSSSSSLPLQALSKDETLRLTRRRKNRASYSVKDVNMDENSPHNNSTILPPVNDTGQAKGRDSVSKRRGYRQIGDVS